MIILLVIIIIELGWIGLKLEPKVEIRGEPLKPGVTQFLEAETNEEKINKIFNG